MRRTTPDDSFASEFGRELSRHYEKRGTEVTDEQFAATLGVSRPALRKYLRGGAMPGLGTVVLAFRRYGVNVPYQGTPLFGKRHSKNGAIPVAQLILPFSVHSPDADIVETSLDRKSPQEFEFRLRVTKRA